MMNRRLDRHQASGPHDGGRGDIYPPQQYARVGDLVQINGEGWWVRDLMDYGRRLVLEEFVG